MPEHLNKPEETGEMTQQAYNEIVKVRHEKLKALRDAGKDPFVITKYPQTDYSATAKAGFTDVPEGQLGKAVCMAGRMMSKRVMGKASFAHLRDNEGDIQIYVRRDDVGDEAYADFKKFDIGDIIGVKGNLFRTKMGEISVHATEVTLLSKSLLPLPEKFHGLRDTELPLKRLIVGGLDRVYEIGRIFRNEGMDPKHNPEFTTIELYQAYADFHDMMDIAEGIISGAAKEILGTYDVEWMGYKVNLAPGWKRMTMVQAVKEYVGIDFDAISDDAGAVAAAKAVGVELADTADKTWGNALYACFDQKVEENLIQPTFITMYPVEVSPLSKRSPADARLTERFELFICHSELANAFSELNDPIDQRGRFQKQVELRAKGDDEAGMMDEDYLTAMEYGLPPTGGMGIGVDRTVMMLTNSDTIREVILFPTMKPLEKAAPAQRQEAPVQQEDAPAAPAAAQAIDFSKVEIEPLFEEFVDFDTFSKSDFRAVKVKECTAVPKSKKLLKFVLDDGTGTDRVILSGIHDTYEPEELVGKTLIAITNLPPRKMMGIDSCGMIISAVHHEEGVEKLHCLMVDDHIPAGAKLY